MKRSHNDAFAWKERCMNLMEQDKPLLIAFDLDYTLWPCYCHEHTLGPYTRVNETSVLYKDPKTKASRTLSLYPETIEIFRLLRSCGIFLSLASKSPEPTAAQGILSALDIWSYFEHPQIYNGRKTSHFRLLRSLTNIPYNRMLFFDDEARNVEAVKGLGVITCLIDKKQGLGGSCLCKGLIAYISAQKTSQLMQRWLLTPHTTSANTTAATIQAQSFTFEDHSSIIEEDNEAETTDNQSIKREKSSEIQLST